MRNDDEAQIYIGTRAVYAELSAAISLFSPIGLLSMDRPAPLRRARPWQLLQAGGSFHLKPTGREGDFTRSVFRCVKGVCVSSWEQSEDRSAVAVTMAQLLRTGQYCGNQAPRPMGKEGGCLEVLHCSCWMVGIMGVGDAGCFFFVF